MGLLADPTILLILLAVALVILVVWWQRGDPEVESPRSQMDFLEEALRERGFRPLIPLVRDFNKYNEADFLKELQRLLVPFMQDREFIHEWLSPILMSNLPMIMGNPELRIRLDMALRKEYGYRLKPIRHIEYGIRPETTLYATREEGDVCFREEDEISLSRGHKEYVDLDTTPKGTQK